MTSGCMWSQVTDERTASVYHSWKFPCIVNTRQQGRANLGRAVVVSSSSNSPLDTRTSQIIPTTKTSLAIDSYVTAKLIYSSWHSKDKTVASKVKSALAVCRRVIVVTHGCVLLPQHSSSDTTICINLYKLIHDSTASIGSHIRLQQQWVAFSVNKAAVEIGICS